MRYLCLVYNDHQWGGERDAAGLDEFEIRMQKNGRLFASGRIDSSNGATKVRVLNGAIHIHSEAEQGDESDLCGYILLDARDLNDVVRVCSQVPSARNGRIVVLPVVPDTYEGDVP